MEGHRLNNQYTAVKGHSPDAATRSARVNQIYGLLIHCNVPHRHRGQNTPLARAGVGTRILQYHRNSPWSIPRYLPAVQCPPIASSCQTHATRVPSGPLEIQKLILTAAQNRDKCQPRAQNSWLGTGCVGKGRWAGKARLWIDPSGGQSKLWPSGQEDGASIPVHTLPETYHSTI